MPYRHHGLYSGPYGRWYTHNPTIASELGMVESRYLSLGLRAGLVVRAEVVSIRTFDARHAREIVECWDRAGRAGCALHDATFRYNLCP